MKDIAYKCVTIIANLMLLAFELLLQLSLLALRVAVLFFIAKYTLIYFSLVAAPAWLYYLSSSCAIIVASYVLMGQNGMLAARVSSYNHWSLKLPGLGIILSLLTDSGAVLKTIYNNLSSIAQQDYATKIGKVSDLAIKILSIIAVGVVLASSVYLLNLYCFAYLQISLTNIAPIAKLFAAYFAVLTTSYFSYKAATEIKWGFKISATSLASIIVTALYYYSLIPAAHMVFIAAAFPALVCLSCLIIKLIASPFVNVIQDKSRIAKGDKDKEDVHDKEEDSLNSSDDESQDALKLELAAGKAASPAHKTQKANEVPKQAILLLTPSGETDPNPLIPEGESHQASSIDIKEKMPAITKSTDSYDAIRKVEDPITAQATGTSAEVVKSDDTRLKVVGTAILSDGLSNKPGSPTTILTPPGDQQLSTDLLPINLTTKDNYQRAIGGAVVATKAIAGELAAPVYNRDALKLAPGEASVTGPKTQKANEVPEQAILLSTPSGETDPKPLIPEGESHQASSIDIKEKMPAITKGTDIYEAILKVAEQTAGPSKAALPAPKTQKANKVPEQAILLPTPSGETDPNPLIPEGESHQASSIDIKEEMPAITTRYSSLDYKKDCELLNIESHIKLTESVIFKAFRQFALKNHADKNIAGQELFHTGGLAKERLLSNLESEEQNIQAKVYSQPKKDLATYNSAIVLIQKNIRRHLILRILEAFRQAKAYNKLQKHSAILLIQKNIRRHLVLKTLAIFKYEKLLQVTEHYRISQATESEQISTRASLLDLPENAPLPANVTTRAAKKLHY